MPAHYLDWFNKPPNGEAPEKELSEWFGFESLLHINDGDYAEYIQRFIKKKYNLDDKGAEEIFSKAEKLYYDMMEKMSREEKIAFRIKCNQRS